MKPLYIVLISILVFIFSCQPQQAPVKEDKSSVEAIAHLQSEVDSLRSEVQRMREDFRPPLGGIMTKITQNYFRLWTAGVYRRWLSSNHELSELKDGFQSVLKFHPVFQKDGKSMSESIDPEVMVILDNLQKNITDKNKDDFVNNFNILTNSCNTCHKAHDLDLEDAIKVKLPAYNNSEEGYY